MKYNISFDHLRNVSYVFDFQQESAKIYDLYFKYLPTYEIFIRALKSVEISGQADRIRPAHFLHNFIEVFDLKEKKVEQTIIEILNNYTDEKNIKNLYLGNNKEIINNINNFLKTLHSVKIEMMKHSQAYLFNINNNEVGKHINKNLLQNSKIESTVKNSRLIDILLKGILVEDNELDRTSIEAIEKIEKNLTLFATNIDKNIYADHVDINAYDVLNAYFFNKILDLYFVEITHNYEKDMETGYQDLNKISKYNNMDIIYDLSNFIKVAAAELKSNDAINFKIPIYSMIEEDLIIFKNIYIDEKKQGQVLSDKEVSTQKLESTISFNKIVENPILELKNNNLKDISFYLQEMIQQRHFTVQAPNNEIIIDKIENVEFYGNQIIQNKFLMLDSIGQTIDYKKNISVGVFNTNINNYKSISLDVPIIEAVNLNKNILIDSLYDLSANKGKMVEKVTKILEDFKNDFINNIDILVQRIDPSEAELTPKTLLEIELDIFNAEHSETILLDGKNLEQYQKNLFEENSMNDSLIDYEVNIYSNPLVEYQNYSVVRHIGKLLDRDNLTFQDYPDMSALNCEYEIEQKIKFETEIDPKHLHSIIDDTLNMQFNEIQLTANINVQSDSKMFDDYYTDKNIKPVNNEISIERLPYINGVINKQFTDYSSTFLNDTKLSTFLKKFQLVIKKEKNVNYDEIENIILDNVNIFKLNFDSVSKHESRFENFDFSSITNEEAEILIHKISSTEKKDKRLSDLIFKALNGKETEGLLYKVHNLEKKDKALSDYDILENINTIKCDIINSNYKGVEENKQDIFNINNFKFYNLLNFEILKFNSKYSLSKTSKILNSNLDDKSLDDSGITIDISNKLFNTEKSSKQFFELYEGLYKNIAEDIALLKSSDISINKQLFDNNDSDMNAIKGIDLLIHKINPTEKINKNLTDAILSKCNIFGLTTSIHSEKAIEKSSNHNIFEEFQPFKLQTGNIDSLKNNDFTLTEKLNKQLDNSSDVDFTKTNGIEINVNNHQDSVDILKRLLDSFDDAAIKKLQLSINKHNLSSLEKKQKKIEEYNDNTLDQKLVEIISNNSMQSNTSVKDLFYEIITEKHVKYFETNTIDTLNKATRIYSDFLKIGILKRKYRGADVINGNNVKNNFTKFLHSNLYELGNRFIKYRKDIEINKIEIKSKNKAKFIHNNTSEIKTWRKLYHAIIKSVDISEYKKIQYEDFFQRSEILDITEEVLKLLSNTMVEAMLNPKILVLKTKEDQILELEEKSLSKSNIEILKKEQDILYNADDEIAENESYKTTNLSALETDYHKIFKLHHKDDEIIDFEKKIMNTSKSEIKILHHKKVNELLNDEILDIDADKVAKIKKLETYKVKHLVASSVDNEIEEEELLKFVKLKDLDINLCDICKKISEEIEFEIDDFDPLLKLDKDKIEAINSLDKIVESRITNDVVNDFKKYVEPLGREIKHHNPNKGAETGQRGFNPTLLDWWSQDWVFLTERTTPFGEMIKLRKEAVRDFKNFMERISLYKDPIQGIELDEIVYKWSINTDYDLNYVNEIEHFYHLVHNKVGKNNYYTKAQLDMISNIIIKNYEEFYIGNFEEYNSKMHDTNEEVRIRLRAMLHFYLFLEQLIDGNKGYLTICTVQEGINLIQKILRQWIESETSYFQPTDEELSQLDPIIAKKLKKNLPKDYEHLVRWFNMDHIKLFELLGILKYL